MAVSPDPAKRTVDGCWVGQRAVLHAPSHAAVAARAMVRRTTVAIIGFHAGVGLADNPIFAGQRPGPRVRGTQSADLGTDRELTLVTHILGSGATLDFKTQEATSGTALGQN